MMDFVTYQTALTAKVKGFDLIQSFGAVNSLYDSDGDHGLFGFGLVEGYVSAPTQNFLQKWLRTEHDIHVTPCVNSDSAMDSPLNSKRYETVIVNKGVCNHDTIEADTYEEALELGLLAALNQMFNKR